MTLTSQIFKLKSIGAMAKVEGDMGALRPLFTINSTDINDKPIEIKLYRETREGIEIPRGIFTKDKLIGISRKEYKRVLPTYSINLRDKQIKLTNDFVKAIEISNPLGGILYAKTGTGKTVMALHLIQKLGGYKTLVIVPLQHLMTQWKEMILTHTDIKKDRIGIIQGSICNIEDKDIVIAMLHSVVQKTYPKQVYDMFGIVIADEVHKLGAETFSRAASMFDSRIRIGLSATPKRKDGTANAFLYHIGPILSRDDTLEVIPKVIRIYYTHENASSSGCVFFNKLNLGRYFTKLSKIKERNSMIIKIVTQLYAKNRNILVLFDRIEHIQNIKEALSKNKDIDSKDIGIFIQSVKEGDRKIILGTYGSCGIGVDLPNLDTVLLASPRGDIEQAIGRILRYKEDKKQPIVIDITDTACNDMRKWSNSRRRFYDKIGAEVIEK